jgi:ABC-type uncharacterized transport system auxiliary subunit
MTSGQIVTAAFGLFVLLAVVTLAGCGHKNSEDQLYKMVSQPQLDSYIEHPEVLPNY